MSSVSVDSAVIQKLIKNCSDTISRLEKTKQGLVSKYQSLGSSWSDSKYKYLGTIIEDCSTAINRVSTELQEVVQKLERVNVYIQEYESVNFTGGSGNASSGDVSGLFNFRSQASSTEASTGATNQILNQPLPWRRISTEHSSAQDLAATNSNWTPDGDRRWRANCQRCVPTYEMRRRGYDVTAGERPSGSDYLSQNPFDVWNNPNVIQCTGNGYYDIRDQMSAWGDGARAQVVVMWTRTSGHTFIAEQVNGITHFYEPQNGNTNVESYFSRVRSGQTRICRIDNAVPSQRIYDCCEEVQSHD